MMQTKDFNFNLPPELIGQIPIKERDHSRLLVMNKKTGELEHKIFTDIIDYLNEGDCLVLNNSKVIPARLFGLKEGHTTVIEFLLLKRININTWETMVRPGKKVKLGAIVSFGEGKLIGEVIEVKEDGNRIVYFKYEGIFEEILDELGKMPLPPYITVELEDKARYQTVYAVHEGSAAAPTAGLHWTNELLKKVVKKGVQIAYVTLHVGLGTFRPVKVTDVLEHKMHSEYYNLLQEDAEKINKTRENGGKIVSVGTTSTRTIESIADDNGKVMASSGWTDIFIYPGYKFKTIDALITNFHLPESTLIMLVSALSTKENVLNAYNVAVKEKYHFFSFGDAMLIV